MSGRQESVSDAVMDQGFEILGLGKDVANTRLQSPAEPEAWIPYTVTGSGAQVLFVRTEQAPALIANAVQEAVWATDSGVALAFPSSLDEWIGRRVYAGPRFAFLLMGIFGVVGLVLVTVGVYSVLAYTTARRTHEIGIRMALGAERKDVLRLVIRAGLRLVLGGIVVGLIVSLVLGRMMATQLTGISTYDPATLASTAILLIGTGAAACWIPALRAARVEPVVALRYE